MNTLGAMAVTGRDCGKRDENRDSVYFPLLDLRPTLGQFTSKNVYCPHFPPDQSSSVAGGGGAESMKAMRRSMMSRMLARVVRSPDSFTNWSIAA